MSFTLVPAIWANGPADSTQKYVLLALADYGDDDGENIFPSIETIAEKCGLSESTIIRAIKGLVEAGYLERRRRRSTANLYHIVVERLLVSVKTTDTESVSVKMTVGKCQNDTLQSVKMTDDPITINQSLEKEEVSSHPVAEPTTRLREHFTAQTAIYPNDRTGTYDRNWVTPLETILVHARGDPAAGMALIDEALAVARGRNEQGKTYTVSSPRSIVAIAVNLAASQKGLAAAADADSLWQRALDAITRRDFSDTRLKAAIRAVGGTNTIASANGYDTDKLKMRLVNEYRRVSAAA